MALFNLRKAGCKVEVASDGVEGLAAFSPEKFDLVITDVKMPGISGIEVLRRIRTQSKDIPVLVITAFGNVETAVEAMKEGAYDFIGKPFHRDQLLLAVEKALERKRLNAEVRDLRIRATGVERDIVNVSAAMKRILEMADRVAGTDATCELGENDFLVDGATIHEVRSDESRAAGDGDGLLEAVEPGLHRLWWHQGIGPGVISHHRGHATSVSL